jgi:ribose 5-phosphate isomerase A
MGISPSGQSSPGRAAAARSAAELIEEGMAVGLGSGRAVWAVIEEIGLRWPENPPIEAVVASEATYGLARAAGIPVRQLDGRVELDVAIDGADEIDPELRLLKGGGGALLREKIVAAAARRFVVVAERRKLVERLGIDFHLPVEVVRFGWRETQRRLAAMLPESERRVVGDEPYQTDEGHFILDCAVPADLDLDRLDLELKAMTGVVEHGLFVAMAERALLGTEEGEVEVLEAGRV